MLGLWEGHLTPQQRTIQLGTYIGSLGILLWAMGPLLNTYLRDIPTFEILSILFGIGFLLSIVKITVSQRWNQVKQPALVWLMGILGIFGNDYFYIEAFKTTPASHVELIGATWPILVILFSGFLPKEKLSLKNILAVLLAFTGIIILVTNTEGASSISMDYSKGYILAFLGAVTWASYTLLARRFAQIPNEMIGMYLGVCFALSSILHWHSEIMVNPTNHQWMILLLMGLTTHGLAYTFWDYGVKRGKFILLNILSYATPIFSLGLLILFGISQFTIALATAATLVVLGAIISRVDKHSLQNFTLISKILRSNALAARRTSDKFLLFRGDS